jgi:hypothetical protein
MLLTTNCTQQKQLTLAASRASTFRTRRVRVCATAQPHHRPGRVATAKAFTTERPTTSSAPPRPRQEQDKNRSHETDYVVIGSGIGGEQQLAQRQQQCIDSPPASHDITCPAAAIPRCNALTRCYWCYVCTACLPANSSQPLCSCAACMLRQPRQQSHAIRAQAAITASTATTAATAV